MSLASADFKYVQDLVYQKSAIMLEDSKAYLVEARLQPIARRLGLASLGELVAQLRTAPMNGLERIVVEAMTTNETYFFRDVHPFEALKKVILPELIKRRVEARQLNIWCAAASSGQEPYTILMLLRENFPALAAWQINFLATDISCEMLDRCREGCYSQLEVNRGLPVQLLVKYFQKIGTEWQIKEELRRMVRFAELNLAQPWPPMAPMDLVLMRNVLIYFNAETKKNVFAQLRRIIRRDGYLFLGGAETPMGIDESFHRIALGIGSCYQLEPL